MIEQRVVSGRLRVEDVQPDPGQPAGREGIHDGVHVHQGAPTAVDQNRPRPDRGEEPGVDDVAGRFGQRCVQADDVADRGEVAQVGAGDVVGRGDTGS